MHLLNTLSDRLFHSQIDRPERRHTYPSSLAVELIDIHKHFGRRASTRSVICGLNMSVERGEIYGLLGPSGCGKTTLLNIALGRLRPNNGNVFVFGHVPGNPKCGIPGRRVGYMPQMLALFDDLTIRETLRYFAYLFGLSTAYFDRRLYFLVDLLKLPKPSSFVKNISGGQQRRVSFAIALLQEPELLILDEPTVGVDPLLRKSIWNHLVTISQTGNVTTVVTTHYIEEARHAHKVGMMRNGRLLAEEPPDNLIKRYHKTNLEDVFLQLALQEENVEDFEEESAAIITMKLETFSLQETPRGTLAGQEQLATLKDFVAQYKVEAGKEAEHADLELQTEILSIGEPTGLDEVSTTSGIKKVRSDTDTRKGKCPSCYSCYKQLRIQWGCPSRNRLWGLLFKNFIRLWRNPGFLVFTFIIPTLQVSIFCFAIGGPPNFVPIGIVNPESDCKSHGDQFYSCILLDYFTESNMMILKIYKTQDLAKKASKDGNIEGIIVMPENYTLIINGIVKEANEAMNETRHCVEVVETIMGQLKSMHIFVYLDVTDQQLAFNLKAEIMIKHRKFTKFMMEKLGRAGIALNIAPIEFGDPIYGSDKTTFTHFMAPGIILSMTYYLAVGLTAVSLIIEQTEGLLERTYMAGATDIEIMLSHLVSQLFILLGQIAVVFIVVLQFFKIPLVGSLTLAVLLTIVQGLCGMAFGLLISAFTDDEETALQAMMGSLYPNLLLSGILWPLSAMPDYLQILALLLPQAIPCEGFRSIMLRGWGISYFPVYMSFFVSFIWIFIFFLLSAIILNCKR